MKKRINLFSIAQTLVFVAWVVVVLLIVNFERDAFYVWPGILCTFLAYGVALASLLLFGEEQKRMREELNPLIAYLVLYFTEIYFGLVVIINTIFIALVRSGQNRIQIAANVILLAVFLIARISAESYIRSIKVKTECVGQKLDRTNMISKQVAITMSFCTDPEVRKRLLRLKERIDMGEGMASQVAAPAEEEFLNKICQIQDLLNQGTDNATVMQQIDEAEKIWKRRTVMVSAVE